MNYGDEGLKDFLKVVSSVAGDSGVLLVEPQPVKCYKSAAKRRRKMGIPQLPYTYADLKLKDIESEISNYLIHECGWSTHSSLGREGWGRALMVFRKSQSSQDTS